VFDERFAYGVQNPYTWLKRTGQMYPPTHEGHYHQKYSMYTPEYFPIGVRMYAMANKPMGPPAKTGKRPKGQAPPQTPRSNWALRENFQPRAMVLADDVLFLAGWLDAVAIQPRTGRALDPDSPDPRTTVLRAVSTDDGQKLAEYPLRCEPVFDGLIAANRRLYLSLKDGSILCMGAK